MNNAKDAFIEKNIQYPEIIIILKKENNKININIKDNTGGIPVEVIDKIFEPYFSTKKDKNGTGFGLYIAKIILEEQLQESIEVFNDDNGTNFEIILNSD